MDWFKKPGHQQRRVTNPVVAAPTDGNIPLDMEKTGLQPFGCQSLGVHVNVADGVGELGVVTHGADEGHFCKDRSQAVIGFVAHLLAQ